MNRQEFDQAEKELIKRETHGNGPMAMNVTDWYRLADGRIVLHEWAMGGESFTIVRSIKL